MTAIVWVETESRVRIPSGLSRPVRAASRRTSDIAAG
jgi:hypothetical protein